MLVHVSKNIRLIRNPLPAFPCLFLPPLLLNGLFPVVISYTKAHRRALCVLWLYIWAKSEVMFWKKQGFCLMLMIMSKRGCCGTLNVFQRAPKNAFNSQPVTWVCLAGASRAVTDIPMVNYWWCGQVKRKVSAALQAHIHAGCILSRRCRLSRLKSG